MRQVYFEFSLSLALPFLLSPSLYLFSLHFCPDLFSPTNLFWLGPNIGQIFKRDPNQILTFFATTGPLWKWKFGGGSKFAINQAIANKQLHNTIKLLQVKFNFLNFFFWKRKKNWSCVELKKFLEMPKVCKNINHLVSGAPNSSSLCFLANYINYEYSICLLFGKNQHGWTFKYKYIGTLSSSI